MSKFKVGDKVRCISAMSGQYIEVNKEYTIHEIRGTAPEEYIVLKEFIDIHPMHNYKSERFESVEDENIKTNIIKKTTVSKNVSFIEFKLKGLEIDFNIVGYPMNLCSVLKILLRENKLYKYNYTRKSPFKIVKEFDKDKQAHSFNLNFIDINTYEKQDKELISTNNCMQIVGEHKMFIPDLLELCVDRNLLKRAGNGYELISNLDMYDWEYVNEIPKMPSREELKSEGYIIPKWFDEHR